MPISVNLNVYHEPGESQRSKGPDPSDVGVDSLAISGRKAGRPAGSAGPQEAEGLVWSTRVTLAGRRISKAYARNLSFSIEGEAGFSPEGSFPSALEYLLGALGADVLSGFERRAEKKGLTIDTIELSLSGRIENPLVILDVVGAKGSPAIQSIAGTLYVTADADESALNVIWLETLARSPLVKTLERSVAISLRMRVTP